ncbi:hypothetical protein M409DRAFT_58052 [Zasmidium cellare ATCC 36951]|uniref:Uncharacterized protein n=1 Tax=Zasmidium cellare ATCC 36951 TaxID=1080233 RepID=A0A6A6C9R5_ZASCE|nr:uncharacterized protein M409DRAFT_58052 [Zasmidium cellare ATCC 36951]KAF2162632.1 hypothetical protein M409DRAFT_58052 [Zasmidium cellare ATCC 36951]
MRQKMSFSQQQDMARSTGLQELRHSHDMTVQSESLLFCPFKSAAAKTTNRPAITTEGSRMQVQVVPSPKTQYPELPTIANHKTVPSLAAAYEDPQDDVEMEAARHFPSTSLLHCRMASTINALHS